MENRKLDKWELALEDKLKELQDCQQQKGLDSCFKCELTFECNLRKEYVKAVYESMNKGQGGGFEF